MVLLRNVEATPRDRENRERVSAFQWKRESVIAGSGSPAKWEIAGELQRQAIADAMDPRTLCVDSTKTVARLWTRQSIEATETL
ncbi:hypothetical protein V1477_011961 [Vespula maculifrons]|uniref:Uncharacterized protein n=1 Tax=Vespula maculifrons TaxID=7453 RepID=A0ABD2C0P4_VESMC